MTIHFTQRANWALLSVFFVATLFIFFVTAPSSVHGQTISVCSEPNVGNFVPYIYEGELHSFDYTVFDNDRGVVLPLQTIIDGRGIEARYSSEWTSNGDTRVHVDVPGWEGFNGTFPVTVHVKTGPDASCETQATFTVSLPNVPITTSPTALMGGAGAETPTTNTQVPSTSQGTQQTPTTDPGTNTAPSVAVSVDADAGMVGEDTITDSAGVAPIEEDLDTDSDGDANGFLSFFAPITPSGSVCKTLPLASWVALAVLHLIIAGIIIFFLREFISDSNLWFTVALLVPFVGFLLAWFLLDGCRMHQWFPVVVALISLGTVLGIPAEDDAPKRIVASNVMNSGGPVVKVSDSAEMKKESKANAPKETVIKF